MIIGSLWEPGLEMIFRNRFGKDIHACHVLSSHGSDRIILRLASDEDDTAIGIINKDIKENRAFIKFSGHFKKHNLNVPEVYGTSEDLISYVIEDLGDTTLFTKVTGASGDGTAFNDEVTQFYREAISALTKFQIEAGTKADFSLCYQYAEFGEENIEHDLNYFRQRFLENYYPEYGRDKLNSDFAELKKKLLETPRDYFLYRDFQSRNIMVRNGELYFIDYQSGRRGALQYDLASLLYDAKADVPQEIRYNLIEHYLSEAGKLTKINQDEFKYYFWYFAIIRILQALGAYGYLGLTRGKKRFLDSIPYALKNIRYILNNRIDGLSFVKGMFEKMEEKKERSLV